MGSYQRQSLETVVIHNGRSSKGATGSEVWNLNLDQIESGTGRILAKQIVPVDGLGSSTFSFEAGTVLYSKLRPYLNKVIVADEDGVATTELVPLRCNPEKLLPEYLAYYLRSPEFLGFANVVVAGAKMPRMVMGEFWKHQIPLPPLPEQRCIAAILDQADTLRAKRREALAELDQFKQSIFIEMFGDPVRGNGLYPVATVESIAAPEKKSIVDGPFGSSMKPDDYRESGIPVIRIANITKEGEFTDRNLLYIDKQLFEKLKRSRIMPYDVLVSRVGTIGNTCIFPEDIGDALLSTTGVCKITPNKTRMLPEFLHQAILQPSFQQQIHKSASTSVQKYFNLSALRGWSIITPPISVQSAFVEHLTMAQKQKGIQSRSLQDFDSLFSSLQHRAFRGEL